MCHPYLIASAAFQIFHSGQGAQGILGQPSKQQLDTVFGTTKDIDVMEILLKKGTAQAGEGIANSGYNNMNATRGSAVLDTKGGSRTSGI